MIGYLKGELIAKNPETLQCVLEVMGIGYELSVPKRLYESLSPQQQASFWIHTVVREDSFSLYGFSSESEKNFFRVLLGVSGLGPKTALALLGEHGAQRLASLILSGNTDDISAAPGVGKKTAQRLVLELGGKLEKFAWAAELRLEAAPAQKDRAIPTKQWKEDLASALLYLGYGTNQVKNTLKFLKENDFEALGFEACLRLSLREMARLGGSIGEKIERTGGGIGTEIGEAGESIGKEVGTA